MPPKVPPKKGFRQVKGGGMDVDMAKRIMSTREHLYVNALAKHNEKASDLDLDVDIVDTSRNHLGTHFRMVFMLLLAAAVVVLLVVKMGGESIEPPTREEDEQQQLHKLHEDAASTIFEKSGKKRETGADTESWQEKKIRLKKEMKEAQEAKKAAEDKIHSGECTGECLQNALAIRDAGNQLQHVVVTDYYNVLNVKSGSGVTREELKKRAEEMKAKVERGDEDVRHLDVAEIDEAYYTLADPNTRMYFNLYGTKPTEAMRTQSDIARHGGSGQEFLLQKWKTKKLLAWMKYFDNAYVDFGVLGFMALTTALPVVLNFRNLIRTMKHAFPDLDPDAAPDHERKMAELRAQTLRRRR